MTQLLQKVHKNKVLVLDDFLGQRMGKNMHNVGERIKAQLLQILHRQKELLVALLLSDLKQPVDAVQSRLLHLID